MNERPTPETDAFFRTFADGEAAPSHAEYFDRMRHLERERDEARAETNRTRDFMDKGFARAREEIAAERALADRLFDSLMACEPWVNQPCDVKTAANKALMAWKEARK